MSVHMIHMEMAGGSVLTIFDEIGRTWRSFSPEVDGRSARFSSAGDGKMKDSLTGSIWDAGTGVCETGEMKGKSLQLRGTGRRKVRARRSAGDERMAS